MMGPLSDRISLPPIPVLSNAQAISHADRFMSSPSLYTYDKAHYQLIVITCLYIAIKVDIPAGAPTSSDVSHICRGAYTAQEVESEELCVLQGLDWRLAPPTAPQVVAHILALAGDSVDRSTPEYGAFADRIDRQLDASLSDLNLLRPSTVAVAAVLNSLEDMSEPCARQAVLMAVMAIANRLDFDPIYDIDAVRHDLAYLAASAGGDDAATADSTEDSSFEDDFDEDEEEEEEETTAYEDDSVRSPTSAVQHVSIAAYCEPIASSDGPASSSEDYYCKPIELSYDDKGIEGTESDQSIEDEVMEDMVRSLRRQTRRRRRRSKAGRHGHGGFRRSESLDSSTSSFYSSCSSTLDRIPEEVDVEEDERQVSFLTLR